MKNFYLLKNILNALIQINIIIKLENILFNYLVHYSVRKNPNQKW